MSRPCMRALSISACNTDRVCQSRCRACDVCDTTEVAPRAVAPQRPLYRARMQALRALLSTSMHSRAALLGAQSEVTRHLSRGGRVRGLPLILAPSALPATQGMASSSSQPPISTLH